VNQPASLLQQTFSLPFVCQYQVLEAHVVNAKIANDPACAFAISPEYCDEQQSKAAT
jgi:hypothetical protein